MKRRPYGYTIIEVMMFLLVSSALLGSVMTVMSGKQESTRFTKSVESFERRLNDLSNDASTGYYPSAENFTCSYPAGGTVSFSPTGTLKGENGGNSTGTNAGCVFLGKAVQFRTDGDRSKYTVYTIVGSEQGKSLADVNLKPALLGVGNSGIKEDNQLPADLEITKIIGLTDNTDNTDTVSGISIISDFTETTGIEQKVTGNASRVTLFELRDDYLPNPGPPDPTKMKIANKGIMLCLQQGGFNGRKAALTFGAGGGRLSTEIKIDNIPECD